MASSNDDIPSLRGWFLKEKRDKYKRQSFLSGGGSNRRWFTIERIPINGGVEEAGEDVIGGCKIKKKQSVELALCYYKRPSENEQRGGWIFLSDVLSVNQDLANRWIIIEHPTRTLRLQSPTPAQHRVWFSTLSKCCKNARKELTSPSASALSDIEPLSLPCFNGGKPLPRPSKPLENSETEDIIVRSPKDELSFLRELTGGANKEIEYISDISSRNLFHSSSSSTSIENNVPIQFEKDEDIRYDDVSEKERKNSTLMENLNPVRQDKSCVSDDENNSKKPPSPTAKPAPTDLDVVSGDSSHSIHDQVNRTDIMEDEGTVTPYVTGQILPGELESDGTIEAERVHSYDESCDAAGIEEDDLDDVRSFHDDGVSADADEKELNKSDGKMEVETMHSYGESCGVAGNEEDGCDDVRSFHEDDVSTDGDEKEFKNETETISFDIFAVDTSATEDDLAEKDSSKKSIPAPSKTSFNMKPLKEELITNEEKEKENRSPREDNRESHFKRRNGDYDVMQRVSSSSDDEDEVGDDMMGNVIEFSDSNRNGRLEGQSSFRSSISSITRNDIVLTRNGGVLKRNDSALSKNDSELSKNSLSVEERQGSSGKDLSKSYSFTSSTYQLHFDNDGDEFQPDEDFVNEDWDEESTCSES